MIITDAKNADIAAISDLHMGKKDDADDFNYPGSEDAVIEILDSDIPIVVFVGDITDVWETPMPEIMVEYMRFFAAVNRRTLRDLKTYFVSGNHDETKNFPFFRQEILVIGDCVFMHGHQFDVFNSGKWRTIGKTITKIGAFIERLGWRNVDKVWSRLRGGRVLTNEHYYRRIMKWVKKNPRYEDKTLVFGHTHKILSEPKQLTNCMFLNTGTRIHGRKDILYFKKEVA